MTWESYSFAYADGYDDEKKRYQGLQTGIVITVSPETRGILVKPEVASKQLQEGVPRGKGICS